MKKLHEDLKIEPYNIRINKLSNKLLNKMKELYHIPKNQSPYFKYKYSNYEITEEPYRSRRRSLSQRINKYILKPNNINNIIISAPTPDKWKPPQPFYAGLPHRNN